MRLTITPYLVDDGREIWEAVCDTVPDTVGRGETEDDALDDWLEQANAKYRLQ